MDLVISIVIIGSKIGVDVELVFWIFLIEELIDVLICEI